MNLQRIHTLLSIISGGALIAIVVFSTRTSLPVAISHSQVAAVIEQTEPIAEATTSISEATTSASSPEASSTVESLIDVSVTFFKKVVEITRISTTSIETGIIEPEATTTDATSTDSEDVYHAALTW